MLPLSEFGGTEALRHGACQVDDVAALRCGDEDPTHPELPQPRRYDASPLWIELPFAHISDATRRPLTPGPLSCSPYVTICVIAVASDAGHMRDTWGGKRVT